VTIPGFDFDLVVVGSGPAGEKAAAKAAFFEKRVALIERAEELGGVCTRGGLPSKVLRQSAMTYAAAKQRLPAVLDPAQRPTLASLLTDMGPVCEARVLRIGKNLDQHKITLLRGDAQLMDRHRIAVRSAKGTQTISAAFIVIATGSRPHRPTEIPFDDERVFCSESILRAKILPRTLTVVGGGAIGAEYASIFAALGTEVDLFEEKTRIVGFLDHEIGDCLQRELSRRGVRLHLGEGVNDCRLQGDSVQTLGKQGSAVTSDAMLFCGGRLGNTEGLGLDAAGITPGPNGRITVDAVYRTSVPNIYAVGDVIGFPGLASTAMEQGRVAVGHAFGIDPGPTARKPTDGTTGAPLARPRFPETTTYPLLPYGIYTIPGVSTVGKTEAQARADGHDVLVGRSYYADLDRGRLLGDHTGMCKLICERDSLKLLGVHIVGASAEELIHIGQACMYFGGTIEYFLRTVFNFPTLSALYKTAAYDALTRRESLSE
jgi:NAD(P) transhydrogenase